MKSCRLLLSLLLFSSVVSAQNDFASLGKIYEAEERPLERFQKITDEQSTNAWAWHFRGLAEDECGLEEAARASFEKALSLDEGQPWHSQALANHWSGRGKPALVASFLDKASELESRPAPKKELRASADAAAKRAEVRAERLEDFEASGTRITLTGLFGATLIGLLYFLLPRLIK